MGQIQTVTENGWNWFIFHWKVFIELRIEMKFSKCLKLSKSGKLDFVTLKHFIADIPKAGFVVSSHDFHSNWSQSLLYILFLFPFFLFYFFICLSFKIQTHLLFSLSVMISPYLSSYLFLTGIGCSRTKDRWYCSAARWETFPHKGNRVQLLSSLPKIKIVFSFFI